MSEQEQLDPRREAFVLAYFETSNASEAYRRANPAARKWKDTTVHPKASRMLAEDKVQARLVDLRDKVADKAVLTLEAHMAELKALRESAKTTEMWAAAIKAEELRGKLMGYYVERAKVDMTVQTHEQALDEIEQATRPNGHAVRA